MNYGGHRYGAVGHLLVEAVGQLGWVEQQGRVVRETNEVVESLSDLEYELS
jgi:hypothetical protein